MTLKKCKAPPQRGSSSRTGIVAGLAPPERLRVGAPLGVGVERVVDKVDARALEGVQVHLGLGFRARVG